MSRPSRWPRSSPATPASKRGLSPLSPVEEVEAARRFIEAARENIDAYMADREPMLAALKEGRFPDPAGAARFLTEDAEWLTLTPPGPHRGVSEMGKVWAQWLETADRYSLTLEETAAVGDRVVAELRATLQGAGSEIEVEQRFYTVFGFREGLIARMEDFADRGLAFAAAEAP